jgi:hypothetical protein
VRFAREDFEVFRAVVEGTGFLPALWLLGDIGGVYLEIARQVAHSLEAETDYLATYQAVFERLERGEVDAGCELLSTYLERTDRALLRSWGIAGA